MTTKILKTSLLILALYVTGCTKYTTQRHSVDYKEVLNQSKEILILPPEAEINTVSFSGKKKRMYDYESHFEQVLGGKLHQFLMTKGYKAIFLNKKNIYDLKLGKFVDKIRYLYHDIREDIYKQHSWKEADAFSLNRKLNLNQIDINVDSDLLLITDYVQNIQTNGARTRDFMLLALGVRGGNTGIADSAIIISAIINLKTGDIIWSDMGLSAKDIFSSAFQNLNSQDKIMSAQVEAIIKSGFASLPSKH